MRAAEVWHNAQQIARRRLERLVAGCRTATGVWLRGWPECRRMRWRSSESKRAAIRRASNQGLGKGVWTASQQSPGGDWGSWTDLGGHVGPQLVVSSTADGRMQLFGTGQANDVWSNWQLSPGGSWAGWSDFGGKGLNFYLNQ